MKKMGLSLIVVSGLILGFFVLMVLPNVVRPSDPEIQSSSLNTFVVALVLSLIGIGSGVFLMKKAKK